MLVVVPERQLLQLLEIHLMPARIADVADVEDQLVGHLPLQAEVVAVRRGNLARLIGPQDAARLESEELRWPARERYSQCCHRRW